MADPTAQTKTTDWQPESTAPSGRWLRTRRDGESGENICALGKWADGEREWVERTTVTHHRFIGGRTTVTHHSFAPPTHWAPLEGEA